MDRFSKHFNQTILILGEVMNIKPDVKGFELMLRTGDVIDVYIGSETRYSVISNLDGLNNERLSEFDGHKDDPLLNQMLKHVRTGDRIYVQGIYSVNDNQVRMDALSIQLMHYMPGKFLFENNTHWWLSQMFAMSDGWLADLFKNTYSFDASDFAKSYRTFLNIYGGIMDNNVQDMQTLSRFIYGLSSAYLLLGDQRLLNAASAGIRFQRTAFRSISHDGQTIIWSHGRQELVNGVKTLISSERDDDKGAIPLYEQIYALAGLAQYYRITGDGEVLDDMIRTVNAFNHFFKDPTDDGYFSHIDPITMRPDTDALGKNKLRKNWNSIGDHIPAYLINLILALDPLPVDTNRSLGEFVQTCKDMLDRCTRLIVEKFPDPDETVPYVNERFFADWKPDHEWGWQQNRAVVGHNLKIAWNLTRVANYYKSSGKWKEAEQAMKVAERLGQSMIGKGLDLIRGGCFDVLERKPRNGQPIQFVYGNHKDFWQQEQAILAYLILYGYTRNPQYLEYSRDMCAWWNAFQLDRNNQAIFFRVSDTGIPEIGDRGMAGYDIAGYHSFELNYLAHIYMRTYVDTPNNSDTSFCLYFRPDRNSSLRSLNVLPDFLGTDNLEVTGIKVNGKEVEYVAQNNFQIQINEEDLGKEIIVQYRSRKNSLLNQPQGSANETEKELVATGR